MNSLGESGRGIIYHWCSQCGSLKCDGGPDQTIRPMLIANIEPILSSARNLPDSPPDSAAPEMTRGQMVAKEMIETRLGHAIAIKSFHKDSPDFAWEVNIHLNPLPDVETKVIELRNKIAGVMDAERKRLIVELMNACLFEAAIFLREGRDYREDAE